MSIQCIRRILRRQWLTNVWILISVVLFIRHVSAPYSNTDFTFVLNKRIFVVSPITFDFHTFLNRWKATLALLILLFTSASVPPCVSTMPPRYQKYLTSSSVSPSSMIGVSQVAFVLRIGLLLSHFLYVRLPFLLLPFLSLFSFWVYYSLLGVGRYVSAGWMSG